MKKTNKKQKINQAVSAVISEYRKGSPQTDPLGMYRGITREETVRSGINLQNAPSIPKKEKEEERPTQDADDL